ncbi:MAG: histidine kinase [Bacteroidota bacterium]
MKLKLFKIPKLKTIRANIAEGLIHFLFGGFFFLVMDISSEDRFVIFSIVATLFFGHALLLLPFFFRKEFFNYLSTTATLFFFTTILGFMTGGEVEEVLPTLFLTLVASVCYGSVRWAIATRLFNYEYTASTKTAELQLLRSQINPHFIFNSLNILYATALEEKSEKTAESIAKMSNLIRYMLEDNTKDFVSVHKEVKYLKDYIKLQLMRSSVEHDIDLHVDITYDQKIAPMMLVPFVENAFKHGIHPSEPSTLFLNFISNHEGVHFQLINSVNDEHQPSDFEKGFGIGISNVEKRLDLIYPRKHTLSVGRENEVFTVDLLIKNKVKL